MYQNASNPISILLHCIAMIFSRFLNTSQTSTHFLLRTFLVLCLLFVQQQGIAHNAEHVAENHHHGVDYEYCEQCEKPVTDALSVAIEFQCLSVSGSVNDFNTYSFLALGELASFAIRAPPH